MVLFYGIITQKASILKTYILIEYTEHPYPLAAKMWAPAVPAQEGSPASASSQMEGAFHLDQQEMVARGIPLLSIALITTLNKRNLERDDLFHLTAFSPS